MTDEQSRLVDEDVDFQQMNHADEQRVRDILDEVDKLLNRADEFGQKEQELIDEAKAKIEMINDIASQYE